MVDLEVLREISDGSSADSVSTNHRALNDAQWLHNNYFCADSSMFVLK